MKHLNRKEFLQNSAILLTAALAGSSFDIVKKKPLQLSFSTLGCPDWTFQQIIDFAKANQYTGLEIRGILREMDLPQCSIFNTPASRASTMHMMKEKGLQFVDLGTSAKMHIADKAERQKQMDEGRRFIDLAHEVNCPFIRVFPNEIAKDQDKQKVLDLITNGLQQLGDHARGSGVSVLMETHGDLVYAADIKFVMDAANHPQTGLVWDITNMWTITKEPPATVYPQIKKYIKHTHIKDAKLVDDKPAYVLLGNGDVPIIEAIHILQNDGYKGYYSYEWEKLWHPELGAPEIAFADYVRVMKELQ